MDLVSSPKPPNWKQSDYKMTEETWKNIAPPNAEYEHVKYKNQYILVIKITQPIKKGEPILTGVKIKNRGGR